MSKGAKLILLTLILSIWNSILFYGHSLGVSVILFIIPLLCLIIYNLKSSKKIVNKESFYLLIPIILLSCTYFIYGNYTFRFLNGLVIILLIDLFIILLFTDKFELNLLFKSFFKVLFKPFKFVPNLFNLIGMEFKKLQGKTKINLKIVKSIIITIIMLAIVISLLSSADMIFKNIFGNYNKIFKILFDNISIGEFIGRTIGISMLFIYLSCTLIYLKTNIKFESNKVVKEKCRELTTIKMVLISLNIIYIIFDIIQIKSLFLHSVSSEIKFSEYARTGFWQLLIISIINLSLILISQKKSTTDKTIKISNLVMILLTFIILISSAYRMHLYEQAYGYTELRLFVYFILLTEAILFIPTIAYIFNNKVNLFKDYFIISLAMYTFINFINIDNIIATRNINRFYKNKKLDIEYLLSLSSDATPQIIKLYNRTDDKTIKEKIENAYDYYYTGKIDWREFNISHSRKIKLIEPIQNKNHMK